MAKKRPVVRKKFVKKKGKNKQKNESRVSNVTDQIKKVEKGIIGGTFVFTQDLTVLDFAGQVKRPASDIVKHFFMQGIMLTPNTLMNEEQIGEMCLEYEMDFEKKLEVNKENVIEQLVIEDDEANLVTRPPIITIMGHVDHGKTSLLDKIRETKVTDGEAGGITQHIGAYQIEKNGQKITFIDTPGHAAFTEMRARGAEVTDIAIIVVAADDGVKPQTKEAVDHAKAAGVTMIVAINKMDKESANPEKVKGELSDIGVVCEEWGGDIIFKEVSAMSGLGIDDLLETINVIAEVEEYKANPNRFGMGTVIESNLDKGRGPVATLLVQTGTLKKTDAIVVGTHFGRIRSMHDEDGNEVLEALPSKPVIVTGLSGVPKAGDRFSGFLNEKEARKIAQARADQEKLLSRRSSTAASLESFANQVAEGELKKINVIIKTDVQGSVEALKSHLGKINVEGNTVNIVRIDVGSITDSDVVLAEASGSILYGFNVKAVPTARKTADEKGIEIREYDIIYRISEELEVALKGLLEPEYEEVITGQVTIKQIFTFSKIGKICGCMVDSGEIKRGDLCRVMRDGKVVSESSITSLKQGTEDKGSMKAGHECGFTLKDFKDVKEEDVVELYKMELVK